MLDRTVTKAVLYAWRELWDSYDLDPARLGQDGWAAKVKFWQDALTRAGLVDNDAVALNRTFLMEWTGDGQPKLGDLLRWLRNRPGEVYHAPSPDKHPLRNPHTHKHAGDCIGRMGERLRTAECGMRNDDKGDG